MRFQQEYRIGASTLRIRLGDIRDARTQAIVTSDDSRLSMGGGTSAAIRDAAGPSVYEAARPFTPVPLGQVVATHAGALAAKGVKAIFHAATIPSSAERAVADQDAVIRGVTAQALDLLRGMRLASIAFPALGTGFARFDVKTVAVTMAGVIREMLEASEAPLEVEIWLLLGTSKDMDALAFLSALTEQAALSTKAVKTHAVILLHGIRTAQGWRERIGDELERFDRQLTPVPIGYGFFDVVRFWLPVGAFRRAAAETAWAKMAPLFDNANIAHVSIVAHSFGTWIVGHLLASKPVHFHRVVLCGAILDSDYPWKDVASKIDPPGFADAPSALVVNDCGIRDVWPVFAKFATWGYGASGRIGFQNALVRDRFHDVDHAGFFGEGFATTHWAPVLSRSVLSKGLADGIAPHYLVNVLTVVKLPVLVLVGLLLWLLA